ncbi:YceI family protein [Teredinibacter turnerae]|uniref:YceI n=1 Tax=Teredinibacter turnerae (strain ATCC 39867 / T7901) TaxID=377629 RepID=C5BL03_TERTT|nr:YceI family protein [Teredinibacter turnerae]ACR12151.1 YceI [Teredinibacter turnerae T7901]
MFKSLAVKLAPAVLAFGLSAAPMVQADDYVVDTKGAHAFVQFRVKHLGYSWLYGRFNDFSGEFSYDPKKPEASSISMKVDMTSLDTNHSERDNHLSAEKYLNFDKYKTATFTSTKYEKTGEDTAKLTGNLTFLGVTKPITIDVEHIGGGKDPWGGYRQGFEGRAVITPKDFGLDMASKLGPDSAQVELMISVEGIRK